MNNLHRGLGALARLPLEVREMVYVNLMTPAKLLINDSDDPGAILRTSHRLFEEVSKILYNRCLVFPISPTAFGMHPLIPIHDNNNLLACLYPDYLYFDSCHSQHSSDNLYREGHDSVYRFLHLPYDRLDAIRFEIPAPSPDDPGELIRMWNALVWLVDLLDETYLNHLPLVEICVMESEEGSWTTNSALHRSVAEPEWPHDELHSDLEILLTPFCRLRRCNGISFDVPPNLTHKRIRSIIQEIELRATWNLRFGEHIVDVGGRDMDDFGSIDTDDNDITALENSWTVWLDYLLDDLPDHSASMTRLHRVNNINAKSRYDSRAESCFVNWEDRLLSNDRGFGGTLLSKDCVGHLVYIYTCFRQDVIDAWNPSGIWAQRKQRWIAEAGTARHRAADQTESNELLRSYGTCMQNAVRHFNTQDAFEMYGDCGIPRESSPEYKARMKQWHDVEKDNQWDCICFYESQDINYQPCRSCGMRPLWWLVQPLDA